MNRPEDLTGTSRRIPAPNAGGGDDRPATIHLDIVISRDEKGRCFEAFVHGAPPAVQGTVNALARVTSAALQGGVEVKRIVSMLKGQVDDGTHPRVGRRRVVSIADALALAFERELGLED